MPKKPTIKEKIIIELNKLPENLGKNWSEKDIEKKAEHILELVETEKNRSYAKGFRMAEKRFNLNK